MCEATYCMYLFRVICVNNKSLAGRKCDISVCIGNIFKARDYLVRGKSVFSYCGIILLTRPDYTFSRRATISPDAFISSNFMFFYNNSKNSGCIEIFLIFIIKQAHPNFPVLNRQALSQEHL